MTKLELDDDYASVEESFELEIFKVKRGHLRPYDFDDDVQLAITYELNRDQKIIRRNVYSFLDLLGDIGGLAGAIRSLFTTFIIVFQYRAVISYISSHTYLIREGDEKDSFP